MFLINVHKNQLRRLRHSRHVQRHGASVKSTSTKASDDSFLSPGPDPLIRRLSFEGEEDDLDILPAMALLHNQQFLQDIMGNNNYIFCYLNYLMTIYTPKCYTFYEIRKYNKAL